MTAVPSTMSAARFEVASSRLSLQDVPVPTPGPHEVLVRVKACGICLSDVHLIDGSLPTNLAAVTPGHEAAGVIAAVGANVGYWQPGQHVVMAGGKPCLTCPACARGRLDACPNTMVMGFSYDGAWAEYVVVPSFALTEIPDWLPFEQAAILADAVSTPYAGLVKRAQLAPGELVGLWGIGGLGVHAVQIARLVGAGLVVALDPSPAARERALVAGADHALDPLAPDVAEQLFVLTGGQMLDLAVDLVGSNAVLAQAAASIGRGGRVLMVGLSMDPIQLGIGALFGVSSHTLLGHLGYAKADLDTVVDLVSRKRLDVSASISGLLPLADVEAGVEQLRTKSGDPIRLVVTP
jgi:D-arabinose 1-dehydrogenase-like Zn-dependent alcohol dehydrogenase